MVRVRAEGAQASGELSGASGSQTHGDLSVDGGVVPQRHGRRPLRASGTAGNVRKKFDRMMLAAAVRTLEIYFASCTLNPFYYFKVDPTLTLSNSPSKVEYSCERMHPFGASEVKHVGNKWRIQLPPHKTAWAVG